MLYPPPHCQRPTASPPRQGPNQVGEKTNENRHNLQKLSQSHFCLNLPPRLRCRWCWIAASAGPGGCQEFVHTPRFVSCCLQMAMDLQLGHSIGAQRLHELLRGFLLRLVHGWHACGLETRPSRVAALETATRNGSDDNKGICCLLQTTSLPQLT